MTALHQQWIDAYDRVKDLPDDELVRTIYKTKIRNTLMKARQRRNQYTEPPTTARMKRFQRFRIWIYVR